MNRPRVRSIARITIYAAVALLAMSLVVAVRIYTGELDGPRWMVTSFILATLGLLTAMPAGYALVMAR